MVKILEKDKNIDEETKNYKVNEVHKIQLTFSFSIRLICLPSPLISYIQEIKSAKFQLNHFSLRTKSWISEKTQKRYPCESCDVQNLLLTG
jgi:hypothetical protein